MVIGQIDMSVFLFEQMPGYVVSARPSCEKVVVMVSHLGCFCKSLLQSSVIRRGIEAEADNTGIIGTTYSPDLLLV